MDTGHKSRLLRPLHTNELTFTLLYFALLFHSRKIFVGGLSTETTKGNKTSNYKCIERCICLIPARFQWALHAVFDNLCHVLSIPVACSSLLSRLFDCRKFTRVFSSVWWGRWLHCHAWCCDEALKVLALKKSVRRLNSVGVNIWPLASTNESVSDFSCFCLAGVLAL